MRFFEDMCVGDRAEIGRHIFTVEEIKSFAQRFDPQPFHLDEAAAAQSLFGVLCASGWHTACLWMRLAVEYRHREDDERRARGEPVAAVGVSPGFRELRWLSPVYPGLHWNGKATQSLPHKSPFFNNSYSYWKIGQYTQ